MASLYLSTIFLILLRTAASEYLQDVCTIFKTSNGLIPPPLPTSFEMKGEIVDNLNRSTAYEEIYFDYMNSKGKYMILHNSVEQHFLFDYNTNQIIMWFILHPGSDMEHDPMAQTCIAKNMEETGYHRIFGFQDWSESKPKMYNSNQMLRYGGQYQVAFNGSTTLFDRGLHVDNFISCLYDFSIDSTFLAEFAFTSDLVETSGATEIKDILGPEIGYLSVPARIQYVGKIPDGDGNYLPFNRTLSISWFKGDPKFKVHTFQIPSFLYCENYRGAKDMPKLPTAFSTRLVVTQFLIDISGNVESLDAEGYSEISYYGEKRLARIDYTIQPELDSDLFQVFQSASRVSCIDDYNTGLQYALEKATGRCLIRPIPESSFFDTHKPLLYRELGTPEEIFHLQMDEMEYKGKEFIRDIDSDLWAGKYFDVNYNATFIKETSFVTNGWHEESDDVISYSVPVENVLIRDEGNGIIAEGASVYNFMKFKAKPPPLTDFNIKSCIEQITHKTYTIKLSVPNDIRRTIFKYGTIFVERAHYYLTDMAQLPTPLRLQRVHLRRLSVNDETPLLVFSVLEKVDFSKSSIIVPQKGPTMQEAADNIQRAVDGSRFAIEFHPPGAEDPVIVGARERDMYLVLPGGTLTYAPVKSVASEDSKQPEAEAKLPMTGFADKNDKNNKPEGKKGMTSGGLTLLAFAMLFIGVGIGIAVMYLYLRMYGTKHVEEKIGMQHQTL